jgi:hypothetical protein
MSVVCRWPPFDFTTHCSIHYQRIRSETIVRIAYIEKETEDEEARQIGSDIFIVPTDDERLKIVIIPIDVVKETSDRGDNLVS